ncbi:IgGFc-binding protein-like isoform X4 [Anomaloglossus baeobatrachus]|uniref:IgGFc-binding protein-like isoform X4 n=1 Tax=Anomaloglossus baeobatrachus TaxID=238106 RepID=UPI003F509215
MALLTLFLVMIPVLQCLSQGPAVWLPPNTGENLLGKAGGMIKGVGGMAGGLTGGLGGILQGIGGGLQGIGGGLQVIGGGLQGIGGGLQGIGGGLQGIGGGLQGIGGGLQGIGGAAIGTTQGFTINPGIPLTTVTGFPSTKQMQISGNGGFPMTGGILQGIGGGLQGIGGGLQVIGGGLQGIGGGLQGIGGGLQGIGGGLQGIGGGLQGIGGAAIGTTQGFINGYPGTAGQQQMQINGMGGFPMTGRCTFQIGGSEMQNGWRKITAQGRQFVTVFLQNSMDNTSPQWSILITGILSSTSVTILTNNSDFKKVMSVGKGETVTFDYPKPSQISGSGTDLGSIIITAEADITVMSRNYKGTSGDVALIYPVEQWGTEYNIFTPTDGPSKHYAEFCVIAYASLTTVTMVLSGAVQYNGRNYKKGDTMTVDLKPLQFIQLQSKDDLSGTRVTSQYPVGVICGHSCVPGVKGCNHVYEQLLPEDNWGISFFVPGFTFQPNYDVVYVMASKPTCLEYQLGEKKLKTNLEARKVMKFKVSAAEPLSIHSTEKIQVFLYGTGGIFRGKPFGSFMTRVPDIESFDLTYTLLGQDNFDNNVTIIMAKTSSVPGFLFNGKPLPNAKWQTFPQSEYSWLEYNYGGGFSSNIMQHPITPFGLLTIGYSKDMAYGSVAPGIQAPSAPSTEIQEPAVVAPVKPAVVAPAKPAVVTPPKPAVVTPSKPVVVTPVKPGSSSSSEEKHKIKKIKENTKINQAAAALKKRSIKSPRDEED